MSTGWRLDWLDGGSATVVTTDGNLATLHSTRQAATGTPLTATLSTATLSTQPGITVRFKVKDCRRGEGDLFVLVGRWVDLTKMLREQLVSASQLG